MKNAHRRYIENMQVSTNGAKDVKLRPNKNSNMREEKMLMLGADRHFNTKTVSSYGESEGAHIELQQEEAKILGHGFGRPLAQLMRFMMLCKERNIAQETSRTMLRM
jgi:hypothetical protein